MVRPKSTDKEIALVDAAIQLFLLRGIRQTRVQDIAAAAGVAVGTYYTYFNDKTAIIRPVAYRFADRHHEFARTVLHAKRQARPKLNDYILGFYDMWQPFGKNSKGAIELADAVIKYAPETLDMAREEFTGTIAQILKEGIEQGLLITRPTEEARLIAISTMAFFPLAGTPTRRPLQNELKRSDLRDLLKWIGRKLAGKA